MPNLSIVKKYYGELKNGPVKMPRERFTRFYQDLFSRFELGEIDPMTYQRGSQRSYVELGDVVLKQCEADGILKNLELLIVCYWAPEFDPEYSAGAYFCDRYGIKSKTFDVCDQGLLSPIMAMKIIKSYFKHAEIKNALLLCLDQTTIPSSGNPKKYFPKKSSALGLFFQKNDNPGSSGLIHAKISPNSGALFFTEKLTKAYQCSIGFLDSDFSHLNCAEILKPIFCLSHSQNLSAPYFILRVLDGESREYGFLLGRG